jgi:hypothetical protein
MTSLQLLRCQLAVAGHTPLRGIQDDVIPITLSCSQGGVQSTLYLDHKPCAVSLRQFRHREALGLPYLSVD